MQWNQRANPKDAWYDITEGESPESMVIPYEDINQKQKRISEKLPDSLLELCHNCRWSCSCFNARGKIDNCPLCGHQDSEIPNDYRRGLSNRLSGWQARNDNHIRKASASQMIIEKFANLYTRVED